MGRSSLIMVLGFTTALLMIGSNISKVSSAGMDNYVYYNNAAISHAIAGAGINLAARALYEDPNWNRGFSNKAFGGGAFSVQVVDLGNSRKRVTAMATYAGMTRPVSVVVQPSSFSRYAYYSTTDQNGYWITGDTIWGPFHCNNYLNVAGTPVFMGRATSLRGINNYQGQAHPVFKGGFDQGINVDLPADLNYTKGAAQVGGTVINGDALYIQFNSNGTVTWKRDAGGWGGGGWTTEPVNSFSPNGVVWVNGKDIHVKGTLNGVMTLGTNQDIWLDGDIVYAADPRVGYSDDLLGLVANKTVWISDNAENNGPHNNFTLMASVFSRTDGLWAEHYNSRGVEGKMTTVGGMTQKIGGYTGVFSGGQNPTVIQGFEPGGTFYDERLLNTAPPGFPTTGQYEIVSWFE
jgi:hypothetical protein